MPNYKAKTVDEYIASVDATTHDHIHEIRTAVKAALPKADEVISYGKPFYKQPKHLVGFDVYKNHINFEIYTGQLTGEHRAALQERGYKTGNKSFQIQHDQSVPVTLIKSIAKDQLLR